MEELIKVIGLTKSYKNSPAVSNLSFSVKKGEILGLLGPNGAGKSTTINILATVLKPDSGNVSICGYNLKNEKNNIKQHLGIVPYMRKLVLKKMYLFLLVYMDYEDRN